MRYRNKRFLASLAAAGLMLCWAGNTALTALAEDAPGVLAAASQTEEQFQDSNQEQSADADSTPEAESVQVTAVPEIPEESLPSEPVDESAESSPQITPEQTSEEDSQTPEEQNLPEATEAPQPAAEEPQAEPSEEQEESSPDAIPAQIAENEPKPEPNTDSAPAQEAVTESENVEQPAGSAAVARIIRPQESYVHTYRFLDPDGQAYDTIPDQLLSPGETLTEPGVPLCEGAAFEGWYTAPQEGEQFDGFGIPEPELTQNEETILYARFRTQFYVFYHAGSEQGSAVVSTQTYQNGADVDPSNVPFAQPGPDMALVGWTDTPGGTTTQSGWTIEGADLDLYPVIKAAAWITYDSCGGTAVEPAYVLSGGKTVRPADPVRPGYAFTGWYTDSETEQAFAFGDTLTESLTLYAGWKAQTVGYRILYWQQNPDDDGYSLAQTVDSSALTGTVTEVTAEQDRYDNFHPVSAPVEQQTVAGDGSTVVNVFYDRDIETIRFYRIGWNGLRREWKEIGELTISARYGQDVSALWPSQRTDLSNVYPSLWRVEPYGNTYQSNISAMPAGGASFYQTDTDGAYTLRCEYWLEGLDSEYALDHVDNFNSDNSDWKLTKEDLYDIKGFAHNTQMGNQVDSKAQYIFEAPNAQCLGWKIYYTRNTYQITFFDGGVQDCVKDFLYQADISGAGYTPAPPEGKEDYTFAGWYLNDELAGEAYDFNDKTMPAGNFALYAKWVPPVYTLHFDLGGASLDEQDDPAAYADQIVTKDEAAQQPGDPSREGWNFSGWIRQDNGEPYNFSTRLSSDLTVCAVWTSLNSHTLTYDRGDGKNILVTDPKTYAAGSGVRLSDPPQEWVEWAQQEDAGFLGWALFDESGNETARWLPGEEMTMPDRDVTLCAVWSKGRSTTLTYDWNDGSGKRVTVKIPQPNAPYCIEQENPTRDGYYFLGWGTEQETDEADLLHCGDTIRVDTREEQENVLYAQWEKLPVPPTGVHGSAVKGILPLLIGAAFALLRRKKREI